MVELKLPTRKMAFEESLAGLEDTYLDGSADLVMEITSGVDNGSRQC